MALPSPFPPAMAGRRRVAGEDRHSESHIEAWSGLPESQRLQLQSAGSPPDSSGDALRKTGSGIPLPPSFA